MSNTHAAAPSAEMTPEWTDYQEFERRHADGNCVMDAHWGADDALEEYLNSIARGTVTRDRASRRRTLRNRINTRKQMHARRRQILLGTYAVSAVTIDTTDPSNCAITAESLARLEAKANPQDWALLRELANGVTYAALAIKFTATVTGLKSRVSRCREQFSRTFLD